MDVRLFRDPDHPTAKVESPTDNAHEAIAGLDRRVGDSGRAAI